jgi:hypothetical protein
MVTLILPGFSPHNKGWLEDTANGIQVEGEIRPVYWEHWTDAQNKFNPEEKAKLLDGVTGKRVVDLIAKSIGTLVASYIVQATPEKIRKVILCGIPLNDIKEEEKEKIKNALKLISPDNIICFQNDEDPHGDFNQVKELMNEINPEIVVISKSSSDHEYPYQDEFNKFLLG